VATVRCHRIEEEIEANRTIEKFSNCSLWIRERDSFLFGGFGIFSSEGQRNRYWGVISNVVEEVMNYQCALRCFG